MQSQRYYRKEYLKMMQQKKYFNKEQIAYIQEKSNQQRIEQYIHFYNLLGGIILRLHREKWTDNSRALFCSLSLMAPLFDDYFDKDTAVPDDLKTMLSNPEKWEAPNLVGSICRSCLLHLHQNTPDLNLFIHYSFELAQAQKESKKQYNQEISNKEVIQLCRDKGGKTALLYRSLFPIKWQEDEKAILYEVGALGQYIDDTFDWYDDATSGIKNIAHTFTDLVVLENAIKEQVASCYKLLRVNPHFDTSAKKAFVTHIEILVNTVWVCIKQYKSKEKKVSWHPSNYSSRKDWICDMELMKNRLQLYSFTVKNHKAAISAVV